MDNDIGQEYILFRNDTQSQAWIDSVNAYFGYKPCDCIALGHPVHTTTYSVGYPHPSNSKISVPIDDKCPSQFLIGQTILTHTALEALGFFARQKGLPKI